MKLFLRKIFFLALPFLILILLYIVIDPFKKIWHYQHYTSEYVMLNRGDVSTRVYLANRGKYKYDSFIFGSSRSTAFTSREWAKYLPKGAVAYSYGSWNESIMGIYRKIKVIDSLGGDINNALVIIDPDVTFVDLKWDPVSNDHYLISGSNLYQYHLNALINYYKNPIVVLSSIDYKLFHKRRGYMKDFIGMGKNDLDSVNNDWDIHSEQNINADSNKYYSNPNAKFYKRPAIQVVSRDTIDKKRETIFKNIRAIFAKRHTNYKLVISPLYDEIKINPAALTMLDNIFGRENVFDYSGKNNITENPHNYAIDAFHYRKKIGNYIMKQIYAP